jgi:hypothetical protein
MAGTCTTPGPSNQLRLGWTRTQSFRLALLAGSIGAEIKKAGAGVPKEFNPEQVAFAEKNSAELTQILATLDEIDKLLDDK